MTSVQLRRWSPFANNARTHSDEQVAQIAASIREFGWTNPVLVDGENGIIAGHGRVLAARKLGEAKVPCIELTGLTEAQKRAYVIADNKLALNADWDDSLLALELEGLQDMGFDTELTGFSGDELEGLFARAGIGEGLTDEDEVPEAPADPVSRPGDLWVCGKHRLLCGDATVATDVERLLDGVAPHLMVTDPPYGVEYDPDWRNQNEKRVKGSYTGKRSIGRVVNDDNADWREAWALFPGVVAYVWHADRKGVGVGVGLMEEGFELRALIVWAKQRHSFGRGHYHNQHEPCWYAVRAKGTGSWQGGRTQTTLWQIDRNQQNETGHSTQKPVECMRRPMENNSSPGQAVYDPFLGSGTSMIAAETTGRVCYGMEIAPEYVDVCVKRWQDFTGEKATLDGVPFDEIAAGRLPGTEAAHAQATA